jgi:hypothetical protein
VHKRHKDSVTCDRKPETKGRYYFHVEEMKEEKLVMSRKGRGRGSRRRWRRKYSSRSLVEEEDDSGDKRLRDQVQCGKGGTTR